MTALQTDICVIGAGSGGLSLAAGAVQMGARVVLIEGGEMGGDCLNSGCVPSKALLAAGKMGLGFSDAKDHVTRVIETIAPVDSQDRFEDLGCTVIRAWAKFIGPDQVAAGDDIIKARRFVIATGSRAFIPPIAGIDSLPYLTNETIFALRDRPDHLLILGGGPIGMEMAQAHIRLGCKVTVVEAARALGRDDPELAAFVLDHLRAQGVEVIEGTAVTALSGHAGAIAAALSDGRTIAATHLLVATGRQVAVDRLGLDAAGVAYDRRGVKVDASLRSSNRRVYAVGDAAGGMQFTHVAGYHAGIVVRQIVLGLPARTRDDHIPRVTYTDPELAQIGLTESDARARYGAKLTVIRQEFSHNDRAVADSRTKGMIKLMVAGGRPVGVGIVGPQAGELIGLWSLAISARMKLSTITGMIAPYPTLGEISKRAAGAYFSPKLFDNKLLKRVVRAIQRLIP